MSPVLNMALQRERKRSIPKFNHQYSGTSRNVLDQGEHQEIKRFNHKTTDPKANLMSKESLNLIAKPVIEKKDPNASVSKSYIGKDLKNCAGASETTKATMTDPKNYNKMNILQKA